MESGKTIGFVSYIRIDLYTVQLNRLAVDQDFRRLKIGEKLVIQIKRYKGKFIRNLISL